MSHYWANEGQTAINVVGSDGTITHLEQGSTEFAEALLKNPLANVDHTAGAIPSTEEVAAALLKLEEEARTQRTVLLTSSDWTQVADSPVSQAAWATYRQALRDVPLQAGFPSTITWPQEPSA